LKLRRILLKLSLATVAGSLLGCGSSGSSGPKTFREEVFVSGLSKPTAMAFAPDGRLFILQQEGRVRVFKQGQLLPADFVTLRVSSDLERGLVGIAFDPQFNTNHYVYLYYTTSPGSLNGPPMPVNRLSRFTANGDVAEAGSETIIIDNIPSAIGIHNGGCLRFAPDGTLFVSVGDSGVDPNAQDLSTLSGKLLRINKDGSVPLDNPFLGQAGKRGEIYAYGLRNPYRFAFKPGTSIPFIGDVGQNTWEEINVGQPGGNYGWRTFEGPTTAPGVISPAYAYNHNGAGASITGGVFQSTGAYGTEHEGSYYFGDYINNFIKRAIVGADHSIRQVLDFRTATTPVHIELGPEGFLYYAAYSTGEIRVIKAE
jgi:glucose/arabinose dehydrogenase